MDQLVAHPDAGDRLHDRAEVARREQAWAEQARVAAARLAAQAGAIESGLDAVRRSCAASGWAGPVRDAFGAALAARQGVLARAAEALREERDRLVAEAVRREQGLLGPGERP